MIFGHAPAREKLHLVLSERMGSRLPMVNSGLLTASSQTRGRPVQIFKGVSVRKSRFLV